jgi:hypothetical protein
VGSSETRAATGPSNSISTPPRQVPNHHARGALALPPPTPRGAGRRALAALTRRRRREEGSSGWWWWAWPRGGRTCVETEEGRNREKRARPPWPRHQKAVGAATWRQWRRRMGGVRPIGDGKYLRVGRVAAWPAVPARITVGVELEQPPPPCSSGLW